MSTYTVLYCRGHVSSSGHIFILELWFMVSSNRRLAEALQVDPTVDPFNTKSSTCKYSDSLKEDARFGWCYVFNQRLDSILFTFSSRLYTHSPSTLIGIPVTCTVQLSNHVVAVQCVRSWRCIASVTVYTKHQNVGKCDFCDFGHDTKVNSDLLGFSYTAVSRVYVKWCEKQKRRMSDSSVGGKTPCW